MQGRSILRAKLGEHRWFRRAFACCGEPLGFLSFAPSHRSWLSKLDFSTAPFLFFPDLCLVCSFHLNYSLTCLWTWLTPSPQLAPESDVASSRKPLLTPGLGAPPVGCRAQTCMPPSHRGLPRLARGTAISPLLGPKKDSATHLLHRVISSA